MTVANDKLDATAGRGLATDWRARHPMLAALLVRGAEVAAWIAFYVVVRILTD
ncbi:hypothetical protein [Vineibacter terrae]|uniref:hypothetical protein n=1 Tax=Vineibacter terrae TaxID=2586908 RepID=UPI002E304A31|nr:hypothetical protein [Vineibacter terrae]HEX2885927.1 hypothetical protein [Vineibacter terrae]